MIRTTFCFLVCAALMGCGGGGNAKPLPKTEPVTGIVTLDDAPLEGAVVTFVPNGNTKGIECISRTDSKGEYAPKQVRGGDGVPVGTYTVVISRFLQGGKPVDPNAVGGGAGGVLTESLPPIYSNPGSSTLTAKVDAGGGKIDFKLTSKKK